MFDKSALFLGTPPHNQGRLKTMSKHKIIAIVLAASLIMGMAPAWARGSSHSSGSHSSSCCSSFHFRSSLDRHEYTISKKYW